MERRVWTWFWYLQSKVLRGEVYEALEGLAWLRTNVLFPLLAASRGTTISGARRVEGLLSDLSDAFSRTSTRVDRAEAMDAIRASASVYTTLADPLLGERGIEPASDARSSVGAALEAGLAWHPPR